MSTENDIASEVAGQGLRMLKKVLARLDEVPFEDWPKGYVRDISDCVMAAVKFQAGERQQLDFERENHLTSDDVRGLIKDYLAALPAAEFAALVDSAKRRISS